MIHIQILSIIFAYATAGHDAPAVNHFRFYGAEEHKQKIFHKWNLVLKAIFCLTISILHYPNIADMIYSGIFSFLWVYLLFDVILNKKREGNFDWWYLSEGPVDKIWKMFSKSKPGIVKALVLFIAIVVTNILYNL